MKIIKNSLVIIHSEILLHNIQYCLSQSHWFSCVSSPRNKTILNLLHQRRYLQTNFNHFGSHSLECLKTFLHLASICIIIKKTPVQKITQRVVCLFFLRNFIHTFTRAKDVLSVVTKLSPGGPVSCRVQIQLASTRLPHSFQYAQ